ncbi:hypothetical protein ANTRET_LOCUS3956 [Anthophora retusa]
MTLAETSRSCCVCKKLFCCAQCRERHQKRKHTDLQLKCPLCTSQKLPLKTFEDETLFCHIIVAHLPLYCYLCGETFRHRKDLESASTCKWWKSQQRHSLVSEQKSILGTPPLIVENGGSIEYNGKFGQLTSPPELYRTTSTPMVVGQKSNFEFETPNVLNFFLKTPKTDSASLKTDQIRSDTQEISSKCDNTTSKYISCPSSLDSAETPFRSLPLNRGDKEDLPRSNSRKLEIMKEQTKNDSSEYYTDNNCVEDMDLTNVEGEILPDTLNLEMNQREKRSDSLKKVRFSDEHQNLPAPSSNVVFNVTENEEYFEARDRLSGIKQSLENSQIKIYEDNAKNIEKENRSPDKLNVNGGEKSSSSSRVVMMVVVENNSVCSTSDLIDTGLKKLQRFASNTNSNSNQSSPSCSGLITSVDSYYSVSNQNYYSPPKESSSTGNKELNSSSNSSNENIGSGGILSVVASAVRSVMKNFSGVRSSKNIEREQLPPRSDISGPSTSNAFSSVSNLASSLLGSSRKRPRDTAETVPSSQRQMDLLASQIEFRSPLAKRPRGWYKIKGREPIARMRNNRQLVSPRGVSSETQVFHQGSLSVGDTVLPLPSRAHQSTQTD